MPSKRELLDNPPASEGVDWAAIQWTRISAFVAGVVATALYVSMGAVLDPLHVSRWIKVPLSVIPVGLMYYGFTTRTWQETVKMGVGIAVGSLLAVYLP